jgi:hypothetical protein
MESNVKQANPAQLTPAPMTVASAVAAPATVRALPSLALSPSVRCSQMTGPAMRPAAVRIPASADDSVVYAVGTPIGLATLASTIDQDALVVCDWDADHKFSTRSGPTASPPV